MIHPIIEENKKELFELCKRHYIKSLYVFGSITKDYFNEKSDIDFLYEIDLIKFNDWATGNYDYTDNILSFESGLKRIFKREIDLIPDIYFQNRFLKKTIDQSKQIVYAA
ncbi:MAG: nucleotidyltransferase domain-containing protein [Bacteroidota bacterium]|nr:nucleotidyltransferase domain-containing protein [Bacteroidota bacterium]